MRKIQSVPESLLGAVTNPMQLLKATARAKVQNVGFGSCCMGFERLMLGAVGDSAVGVC